jgi:hypothetical protein
MRFADLHFQGAALAGALLVTVATVYAAKVNIREKRKAEFAPQCEFFVLSLSTTLIFSFLNNSDFLRSTVLAQKRTQQTEALSHTKP